MATSTNTLLRIDDTDARVVYEEHQGVVPWFATADNHEFNGTSYTTKTVGASINFTFIGSHITVYVTLDGSGGNSTYLIDDDNAGPHMVVHPTVVAKPYQYPLYNSGQLPYSNHTLVITNGASTGTLRLDFLEITTNADVVQPEPSLVSDTDPLSTGTGAGIAKGLSGGIIAAIVLSMIVLLVALGVGIFFFLRCRRVRRLRRVSMMKGFEIEGDYEEEAQSSYSSFSDLRELINMKAVKKPAMPVSQATSSAMFTSVIFIPSIPPSSTASNTVVGTSNLGSAHRAGVRR